MTKEQMIDLINQDYKMKVKRFSSIPTNHQHVMIGDSMIAYLNLNHYGFNDWINMGIAGDTTLGVYQRLSHVKRLLPKKVLLSVGSNDLVLTNHTIDEIGHMLSKIMDELKGIDVSLLTLTPVNSSCPQAKQLYIAHRKNEDIKKINEQLIQKYKSQVIDVYHLLLDDQDQLNEKYTTDGIHLNALGYEIYTAHIKESLSKII